MIDHRRFPFGGIPVYNPQSLSKEEALAQFHARRPVYEHLLTLLRQERSPHVLIIGARGMGKTTLLQRVRYGVEDDVELNGRYLVLVFPEEQYNVNRLHRFLLNTVDAVADAMERIQDKCALQQVETYAESLAKRTPEEIEEQVPQFLADFSRQINRGLLLLVDNADRLFETIEDRQQWQLRELLSTRRDLTFFGATTQASDGIYSSDRAFFEFFQIEVLPPLRYQEVRELLLRLSESVDEQASEKGSAKRRVLAWLEADGARLRTLVQLTGGNPRTTVLLFHLVLDGLQGGAREYLEQLLDQVTPNYKGRVDELSPQAQQVLDAVALHWDPVTAMEVASESGLETGVVSTNLTRLTRQGILEKADPGDSKKALYQVAERFFNIWYLMRASRRVRAKLRWFVEFLRVFFDNRELEQLAWDRIERYRPRWQHDPGEVETAFAYLLASRAKRDRFEHYLRHHCSDTERLWRPYLDLMEPVEDRESRPLGKKRGLEEAEIRALLQREPDTADHWIHLGDFLLRDPHRVSEAESPFRRAVDIDPNSAAGWEGLGWTLTRSERGFAEAESCFRKAIHLQPSVASQWGGLGLVLSESTNRAAEAESAYQKAIELDPKAAIAWYGLGTLLAKTPGRGAEAEAAHRAAIEIDRRWAWPWHSLGELLANTPERAEEAEAAYRAAIEIDPTEGEFWHSLGELLAETPGRAAEAEAAYRAASEINPKWDGSWHSLGKLLAEIPGRAAEAEAAYRAAIEINPNWDGYWHSLGNLLAEIPGRAAEAEAAYRAAIEINPNWDGYWHSLGKLLAETPGRAAEAEAAYRAAIEIDPNWDGYWHSLGKLLAETPGRAAEAEAAYRAAIEIDPQWPWYWHSLGNLLVKMPARAREAEAAYRAAIEIDPNWAWFWHSLGDLLAKSAERGLEAEAAYRKAIEIEPRVWFALGNLLAKLPERAAEAEVAYRKAIDTDPMAAVLWWSLGTLLAKSPDRGAEAEAAYRKALELDPQDASMWEHLGVFLACRANNPIGAQAAFQTAIQLQPDNTMAIRNLGELLYCAFDDVRGASDYLTRAYQIDPKDPVSAAIAAAGERGAGKPAQTEIPIDAMRSAKFWDDLLELCRNYPPFGKLFLVICEIAQGLDVPDRFVRLYRAVAFGQLSDFPRAAVAFEDSLIDDPIETLKYGQPAIETILAAAVRNGRVRDFIEVLDRRDWKDAWRPIYEALRTVESGSTEHLKRVAIEIREPAAEILRRIAPVLRERT